MRDAISSVGRAFELYVSRRVQVLYVIRIVTVAAVLVRVAGILYTKKLSLLLFQCNCTMKGRSR